MCLALQIWSALSIHTCISPRSRCPRIPFWNKRSLTVLYCQSNGEGPLSLSLPLASPPVPLWSHHLQLCAVRAIKQSPFRSLILVFVFVRSFIFEVKNRFSFVTSSGRSEEVDLSFAFQPAFIYRGNYPCSHPPPGRPRPCTSKMGCGGDREKGNVAMEEKWDYVVRDISFLFLYIKVYDVKR